jgi:phage FluMu protein Com
MCAARRLVTGRKDFEMDKNFKNLVLTKITQIVVIERMPIQGTDNGKEQEQEKEPVTLFAGFEWDCPKCKAMNKTLENVPFVKCRNCKELFETQLPTPEETPAQLEAAVAQ